MAVNRLAKETSPYLLQHAHNPVDWYPWGEEALERAKRESRPILLSIGYSACHWCHVMEKESFENEETAKVMNSLYINIKVDREERPDLDQIYQLAVQFMGKGGGWPLTVFLTPEQRPIFGGTYFPPQDKYGRPAFSSILRAVAAAYHEKRGEMEAQAGELVLAIERMSTVDEKRKDIEPVIPLVTDAVGRLTKTWDDEYGGFGTKPKFPNTMALELLLRDGVLNDHEGSRDRAHHALRFMREGGIYDQLGGGFHRYSTDEKWLVPHFEKMLYDNALLLRSYAEGSRVFDDPLLKKTVLEIAEYVARDMTSPSGAFYASEDADSDGAEGTFYVWGVDDFARVLSSAEAEDARKAYRVTTSGNFEGTGKNVLSVGDGETLERIEREGTIPKRLLQARSERKRPFRDEKMLTSWNALMISSLADASLLQENPVQLDLVARAERAFAAVWNGGNLARYFIGTGGASVAKGIPMLDDHAYLARAALDLYEASAKPEYVDHARVLADVALRDFRDPSEGGFFATTDRSLFYRPKDAFDHAIPAAQAVLCQVFLRLQSLIGGGYAEAAEKAVRSILGRAVENPFAAAETLHVVDRLARGGTDIVVVGSRSDERVRALVRTIGSIYIPDRTIVSLDPADPASVAACKVIGEGKTLVDGGPAAYVCRGRSCWPAVTTPKELRALLEKRN